VVVVGAGVGGLTTAAVLARAGLDVTVLEAHVYPGGCAGTFYHQGYRFDAGATLAAGFYPGGPMDLVARAAGIASWSAHPTEAAMMVHLPGGASITRWTDERRWDEHRQAFGTGAESFWRWQESTADALWDLALRTPPWPPRSMDEALRLAGAGVEWLGRDLRRLNPSLAADAFRPVAAHLHGAAEHLRLFVDAQLLIAAQTTSRYTNALYGASALDLPRRGVAHLEGGIGTLATTLAQAVRDSGGQVHLRQEVTRIRRRIRRNTDRTWTLETKRRDAFPADMVIINLPPWNAAALMGDDAPRSLKRLAPGPRDGWGAFMLYAGLDDSTVPRDFPLHHQVIAREPMGEGNTVFLSLSPAWDAIRAPKNKRALTVSTHTDLSTWWHLYEHDRAAYQARKAEYVERVLNAAQVALPHLREAAEMILPGTPVTFERFTRRDHGWVGGWPQTNLFRAWAPRLAPSVWMVGDSIFPGQSTAAVALGGLRVAKAILHESLPVHHDAKAQKSFHASLRPHILESN
jgi:C-3',4' desaturase CrtD